MMRRNWARLRAIAVLLLTTVLLCSCIDYDTSLTFRHPNRGEWVQQIQLDGPFNGLNRSLGTEWLASIEARTQQLGGTVTQRSDQALTATIPFQNGADLETKFNQFFGLPHSLAAGSALEPEAVASRFSLTQDNYLILRRYHLTYELDLSASAAFSGDGNDLIDPDHSISLRLNLKTPWGAQKITNSNPDSPNSSPDNTAGETGKSLTWSLHPNQLNHLEAVFWLPSPLGIGAIAIGLFVSLGIRLKSKTR